MLISNGVRAMELNKEQVAALVLELAGGGWNEEQIMQAMVYFKNLENKVVFEAFGFTWENITEVQSALSTNPQC